MVYRESEEYRTTVDLLDRMGAAIDRCFAEVIGLIPADAVAATSEELRAEVQKRLRLVEARNARLERTLDSAALARKWGTDGDGA